MINWNSRVQHRERPYLSSADFRFLIFQVVRAVGELLLISDDPQRAERLARDLHPFGPCCVHDLYDDAPHATTASLIVSDIEALTSEAVLRLRRTLGALRSKGVPYLFLVHGNTARAEAHARVLGANATLDAGALSQQLRDVLAHMQSSAKPIQAVTLKLAEEAKQFLTDVFFSAGPITPTLAEPSIVMIENAIREGGILDWIQVVQRFDDATHKHVLLVAGLAAAFSRTLHLSAADQHRLVKAALLHDVGKTKIPIGILNKPGKLAEPEMALMRTHAALGHAMLSGHGFEDEILAAVRWHHEMLDGSGYPDKLKGAEISDLVRLVTICDFYGALIEHRPYRAPMASAPTPTNEPPACPPTCCCGFGNRPAMCTFCRRQSTSEKAYGILEGMVGRLDQDLVRAFRPVADACSATISESKAISLVREK